MRVGYVVLYVNDAEACRRFWIDQMGMVEKDRTEVGDFTIVKVGFADQPFAFELVPLAMMADNPDGLDLATPSIALHADDLDAARSGSSRQESRPWRSTITAACGVSPSATPRDAGSPSRADATVPRSSPARAVVARLP